MPLYEFKCSGCGKDFSEIRKTGDYDNVVCPQCGSKDTQKRMSMFSGGRGTKVPTCGHSGGR
jgi:putative FmdB family regulatory protein